MSATTWWSQPYINVSLQPVPFRCVCARWHRDRSFPPGGTEERVNRRGDRLRQLSHPASLLSVFHQVLFSSVPNLCARGAAMRQRDRRIFSCVSWVRVKSAIVRRFGESLRRSDAVEVRSETPRATRLSSAVLWKNFGSGIDGCFGVVLFKRVHSSSDFGMKIFFLSRIWHIISCCHICGTCLKDTSVVRKSRTLRNSIYTFHWNDWGLVKSLRIIFKPNPWYWNRSTKWTCTSWVFSWPWI